MNIHKLGNRLALIICSGYIALLAGITTSAVVGILLAFIVGCIGLYTSQKKVALAAVGCYFLFSFGYPEMILIYPVLLYELIDLQREEEIQWWARGMFAVAGVQFWMHTAEFSVMLLVGVVLVSGLAVWLNISAYQYEEVKEKFIATRDSGTELAIELKNENTYLLEKQDSDIYAATLKERNRIAREIHDNVGHMLSRAILMTGALMAVSKEDATKDGLKGLKDCLDEAMTNIRQSVHDLHDESIDLEQAIRNLYGDMKEYDIKLEYDMERHVPREVKYSMIAIVKECLSNIMKHSSGNRIRISLLEHPKFYKLSVEDNGRCDNRNTKESGIGLHNIKDRVDGLSGTLNITAEKTGFKVYVSIPKK